MSAAKHTPGPWELQGGLVVADGGETEVAEVLTPDDGSDVANDGSLTDASLADGLLIAAAPELLAFLQDAVDSFGPHLEGGDDEWLIAARAAIAKATGSEQ